MNYATCPFCGRNDSKPSREHILANWIATKFPEGVWTLTDLTGPVGGIGPPKLVRQVKSVNSLGVIAKRPCVRCNTGWMKQLEDRISPLLTPLMNGNIVTLNPTEQQLIVRWFLKTVMALELRRDRNYETYFTQTERQTLMKSSHIPATTMVFLARYHGTLPASCREAKLPFEIRTPKDNRLTRIKGYTVTVAIKHLAIQILTVRWPKKFGPLIMRLADNWDDATVQIWPDAKDAMWPLGEYFDDIGLDLFTARWTGLLRFLF